MEKQKIELNIAGKNYVMFSSENSEKLQRVAGYVGRKMDEIYRTSRMTAEDAAVMTAMNIAEEMMTAQDDNRRLRLEIDKLRKNSSEV